jgi:hypothetical protein
MAELLIPEKAARLALFVRFASAQHNKATGQQR